MTVKNYVLDINKTSLQHPSIVLRQDDYNIYTINISVTENGTPVDLGSYTLNFLGITPAGAKIIDSKNFITNAGDLKNGKFSYKFPKEAAGSKGVYDVAYFRLKTTSGVTSTIDLNLRVLGGIDLAADEVRDYITVDNTLFNALTSEVYKSLTTEVLDKVGSKVIYRGPWLVGYVASSSNENEPTGRIVGSAGLSDYKHSDYIRLSKGDLLIANFKANNNIAGISVFDENKNFVKNIQEGNSEFADLAYVATSEFEFVIVSNIGVKLSSPTIQVIRDYIDDPNTLMPTHNDKKYDYYINPVTLAPVSSTTYGTSEMVVVRPQDVLVLKLFGSDGTSLITEYSQNGEPISSTQIGEKAEKYYLVRGSDNIKFIRFTNDFTKLTPVVKLNSNNNSIKFGMLGDSYVRGNKTDPSLTAYNIASSMLGFTYYNYGKNGNTIASYDGYDNNHVPMVIRYVDMDSTLDIVGFEGGRNDYNHNIPIGEDTDTDTTTFKGALNVLCEGLIKKYLGKKLFGVPCWPVNTSANRAGATQLDYLNAFVHIVHDVWGIKILDSRSAGVHMNSPEFLAKYTEDGNSISHLNEDGHALFANKVEDFLNTI